MSTDLEGEDVSDPEEGSLSDSGMDVDGGEDMPNQYGLSQMDGSQELSIFNAPPGQVIPFSQDSEMREVTTDGSTRGGLGQDVSKPGGEPVGGPDAVHGGLEKNNSATGGPRTSTRERKEPLRLDPNNPATFIKK